MLEDATLLRRSASGIGGGGGGTAPDIELSRRRSNGMGGGAGGLPPPPDGMWAKVGISGSVGIDGGGGGGGGALETLWPGPPDGM